MSGYVKFDKYDFILLIQKKKNKTVKRKEKLRGNTF